MLHAWLAACPFVEYSVPGQSARDELLGAILHEHVVAHIGRHAINLGAFTQVNAICFQFVLVNLWGASTSTSEPQAVKKPGTWLTGTS